MYLLGLNCVYHESAVALMEVKDGKWQLLNFAEEERFNRKKRAKSALIDNCHILPVQSIDWVLEQAGIAMADISHVATSMNPEKRRRQNIEHNHGYPLVENDFGTVKGEQRFYDSVKNVETEVRKLGFIGEFHFLNHHDCHSASAYYPSGFSDAVSVVVDGISEFESISIYNCENGKQELVHTVPYPNSLGFLWEKFSEFVGFTEYDAGKVMGMSAFGGQRILEEQFQKLAKITEDGFELDDRLIRFRSDSHQMMEEILGIPRSPKPISKLDYDNLIYFDLAATLQSFTEEALLKVIQKAIALTGKKNLCLSGY